MLDAYISATRPAELKEDAKRKRPLVTSGRTQSLGHSLDRHLVQEVHRQLRPRHHPGRHRVSQQSSEYI